jgi:hypothetical protein
MTDEPSGPFGGMSAAEADKKSHERRRLRKELAESDPQSVDHREGD